MHTMPRLLALVALALVFACSQPDLLNSDRIERRFGSYGVEVLQADDAQRISNLYSQEAGGRICRTLAVVDFALPVDARIVDEHQRIVAGASIGQVFRAAGWSIIKTRIAIGTTRASNYTDLPLLMHVRPTTMLATQKYRFDIVGNGWRIHYADITELHHPDYLSLADLHSLPD